MSIVDDLIRDEGMRLKPYRDTTGHLTIGVGRNLDDVGITKSEAMRMLGNDIEKCKRQLTDQLPIYSTLDAVRQEVLINMCFNLGIKGLLGFKDMIASLEIGNYIQASKDMKNSLWARQVGDRADRLALKMQRGE